MSNRNQNAIKRQTKTLGSKSSEKSKNKNEDVKITEDLDKNLLKTKLIDKIKAKQNDKYKTTSKVISSKSLQSGNSSTKSSSSTASNKSNEIKKTSSSRPNRKQTPSTPQSNRVSKTQFFPSKQMYSNAIKATQDSSKNRERNKTRTLSPSEVKVLKSDSEHSSLESFADRPKTATITKVTDTKHDPQEYEDDFDSYESDFEEYASSSKSSETTSDASTLEEETHINAVEADEERKLDSGNFELPDSKYKQVLDNITELVEKEITVVEQNRSNLTSLSDEGFEDGKIDKSGQFINFAEAQRKQSYLKSLTIKHKRGEELASMIKLDSQTFAVFEMESIPYNIFIKKFGNNNTVQTSVQTGHDNISEEIQTVQIASTNKWTQYPVKLSEIYKRSINLSIYKQESLGVGSDDVENSQELKYNEHGLIQFINRVSDVMLNLLEERSQQRICKDIEINSNQIPFSEGYVLFNTKLPHLENIPVVFANFSNNTTKLITIHSYNSNGYSFLCIWKISDPNMPEYCVTVHGILTCCALVGTYIYGGLKDGTIAIWDLKEQVIYKNDKVTSPTFMTNINTSHVSKVISVEIIETNEKLMTDDTCNSQVYSLDEDGYLIIWTVIVLHTTMRRHISLQQALKISLKQLYPLLVDLQCMSMSVNQLDINHIFISTNYGQVLHFVTTGTKVNPKRYTTGWTSQCNHITTCPFSPLYILAAYENGNMALFSRNIETPLITLTNCDEDTGESGVEFVEWSKNKPCVFYTKDRKNCIHIWDLSISDIFPIYSVPFKENINFIKLSPDVSRDENIRRTYMVIITDKFNVNLHILNKDHGQQDLVDYQNNVKKFLNYVNRL